jgi:hypothetical protein
MSESKSSVNRGKPLLRRFWWAARGFWSGRTRVVAWAMTAAVGAIEGGGSGDHRPPLASRHKSAP